MDDKQDIQNANGNIKPNNKIFIIFIVILLFFVIPTGVFIGNKYLLAPLRKAQELNNKYDSRSLTVSPYITICPTVTPYTVVISYPTVTPYLTVSPYPTPVLTTGVYKNHYGQYQIKVPMDLGAIECMGNSRPRGCSTLAPLGIDISVNIWPMIKIDAVISEKINSNPSSLNFNIPVLGNNLNAYFEKKTDISLITFVYRGATYTFEGNYLQAKRYGYSADKLDEILKETAQSITFLNEPSTCKTPSLLPLTDFPENFVLYNYHESDKTDPVYSYWPYTNKKDNSQYLIEYAEENSKRGFMIHYIRDGSVFSDDLFSSYVLPIKPNKTNGGFDDSGTGIWHLNCINTQEDGPGNEMPYHINEDPNDLFGIQIYGNATNPQALWNVEKWNINLLKSVRDKVYIKRGNLWHSYIATDYFATMPTAYGGKPAIYLYSPKKQSVKVEIHPRGQLIETDSFYDPSISGWQVLVDDNNMLDPPLPYLYYEAMLPVNSPERGYVIPFSQLFDFTKDYIKELGLNDSEAHEFIAFWKSKLPWSPYYFVSNLDQETISQIYPLVISPAPQTLIRIELYFKPLKEKVSVTPPEKLVYPKRVGFTAVEWGGILE